METNKIENVQIYPAKVRIVPNVKIVKNVTNFSDEEYGDALDGRKCGAIEKRNHKRFGDVITSYKISNADDYNNTDPLTEFDRAVLSVCISEFAEGNRYTTPSIIYRALTGKIDDGTDAKPYKDQRAAILRSVEKLMGTILKIDLTETDEKLGYATVGAAKKCSAILPAYFVERTVNGQDATTIYFDRESPIMEIAESRNQIIRFDNSLLDVPNQRNTPRIITLKNYVLCRVTEIKQHRMTPSVTFADIFKKARISDASKQSKLDARDAVIALFEHLKANGVVKSFTLVKKANKFHAVTFTY